MSMVLTSKIEKGKEEKITNFYFSLRRFLAGKKLAGNKFNKIKENDNL
jgi:hypothetical protein